MSRSIVATLRLCQFTLSDHPLYTLYLRRPCCAALVGRAGEWFFPNKDKVPIFIDGTTFYRNRGDDGTVNLNRVSSDVLMPTGRFCCVVPDATSTQVTICANIGTVNVSKLVLTIYSYFMSFISHLQCWSYQLPCLSLTPQNRRLVSSSDF